MKQLLPVSLVFVLALAACKKEEATAPAGGSGNTPCTFTVGPWGPWVDGYRERTVEASPTGCAGTPPASVETHPCVSQDRGWIRIVNNSTNPYQVTITGPSSVAPFELPGGYMVDSLYVGVGTYGLYSLQLSGYILFPSEFNGTRTVQRCNVSQWSFP